MWNSLKVACARHDVYMRQMFMDTNRLDDFSFMVYVALAWKDLSALQQCYSKDAVMEQQF